MSAMKASLSTGTWVLSWSGRSGADPPLDPLSLDRVRLRLREDRRCRLTATLRLRSTRRGEDLRFDDLDLRDPLPSELSSDEKALRRRFGSRDRLLSVRGL